MLDPGSFTNTKVPVQDEECNAVEVVCICRALKKNEGPRFETWLASYIITMYVGTVALKNMRTFVPTTPKFGICPG